MKLKKIYSMKWADENKTGVSLLADTDTENNLSIGTPYDTTSIVWDSISKFPLEEISDYVKKEVVALPDDLIELLKKYGINNS
jgi:post-segregation antitoxin (ccd killing protein)